MKFIGISVGLSFSNALLSSSRPKINGFYSNRAVVVFESNAFDSILHSCREEETDCGRLVVGFQLCIYCVLK